MAYWLTAWNRGLWQVANRVLNIYRASCWDASRNMVWVRAFSPGFSEDPKGTGAPVDPRAGENTAEQLLGFMKLGLTGEICGVMVANLEGDFNGFLACTKKQTPNQIGGCSCWTLHTNVFFWVQRTSTEIWEGKQGKVLGADSTSNMKRPWLSLTVTPPNNDVMYHDVPPRPPKKINMPLK